VRVGSKAENGSVTGQILCRKPQRDYRPSPGGLLIVVKLGRDCFTTEPIRSVRSAAESRLAEAYIRINGEGICETSAAGFRPTVQRTTNDRSGLLFGRSLSITGQWPMVRATKVHCDC